MSVVRVFYDEVWNRWNDEMVEEILAVELVFRGSLGDDVRGRAGFRGYRDKVRAAFPDFTNEVLDLVVDGERAAARLRYTGTHRGPLLGVPATGRRVGYDGAAFFRLTGGQIAEAWVLGDVHGLLRQLQA
jgi:steroid delta-isomerase-like uncharacterized protein